jgi:hypothetical protein
MSEVHGPDDDGISGSGAHALQPMWPEGKRFALTIIDDPDSQTLEAGREVYAVLRDHGLRTTKAVWPTRGQREPSDYGGTCAEPEYLRWCQALQASGFEIALHNVASHTSTRSETVAGFDIFRAAFGSDPRTFAHHYFCNENLYWGDRRVTGAHRLVYNLATLGRNRRQFFGDEPGHRLFWGDICRSRVDYVRNFAFPNLNTLSACPCMPYHDPVRPFVKQWFACAEGSNIESFLRITSEERQEALESEGGASIIYTHFGHGYVENGKIDPRLVERIQQIALRGGWFVPVATMLDHLRNVRGEYTLSGSDRRKLERQWIWHKLRFGTA